MPDLEDRVAALERAVAALVPPVGGPRSEGEDYWLLEEVRLRHPAGAIVFGGTADLGKGEVAWQWGSPTENVLEAEWDGAAGVFDALSHPVRLHLLQRVLTGTATTAELADDETLGTTGQLHHHLRALVAAGWLASVGRGSWAVPPPRVVPLLVVIVAATSR
ncbi:ArsR/SmtB family transcription factor [uncultured Friedmanniella sp.]|uniref:ArsR/SmtB family transcription factor n=1 Tax=uncultured Friedmanniella sp. TaxID=335381 RepID=UPI0035CC5902